MKYSGDNLTTSFKELYSTSGIKSIDVEFLGFLQKRDDRLYQSLISARINFQAISRLDESKLILALAPHVEDFIAKLFGIESALELVAQTHEKLSPVFKCKRLLVQRRAAKAFKPEEIASLNPARELTKLGIETVEFGEKFEILFAKEALLQLEENAEKEKLDAAIAYSAWALFHPDGIKQHKNGLLFKLPKKLDPLHLIELESFDCSGFVCLQASKEHLRERDGFKLTDNGGSLMDALDQANYCIFCANQGKDSCSKGLKNTDKKGCPLEEHISEMNELKSEGSIIGALAAIVIANPICAGTGHRICNDCMKACIYQKQEPVNIPKVETRVLNDVLGLPYGFEIYSLLTRWNPLNFARPYPKESSGKSVLVAGLGPAGYTLAHYLLNDGHKVFAIDGLKIEPLAIKNELIKNINTIYEPLDERVQAGFGGVAEYGITVRWNKNYLKIIRLLLERREDFCMKGGTRLGSQLSVKQAFALGFDHVALCLGAGRPTLLNIPNGMSRGVRAASDFLMSLQLTGAAKKNSIANMHLRLPVVVIGGGLTAIDTATEALSYYCVQVEKFEKRYEMLGKLPDDLDEEEKILAKEWLAHARVLKTTQNKIAALKSWGGATICYRKKLVDSPSYRLNHEEVEKAFEEGISFIENVEPLRFDVDEFGHVKAVVFKSENGEKTLAARSVLIAAGTSPNTIIASEEAEIFEFAGKYFRTVGDDFVVNIQADGRAISTFGDLNPKYAGNVVKAMASAKNGFPIVSQILKTVKNNNPVNFGLLLNGLTAQVERVERLAPKIVEVVIRAPMAANSFKPGQFFRLQNFETSDGFAMEGLAMTGAWVDKSKGLVSTIVLEMGGSSNLCAKLKAGEEIVLMGPTGAPTEIPKGEKIVLVGGGLGNAVLFSIGKALKENGCEVVYFAGYKTIADRFKHKEIQTAADIVIWACDEAPGFKPDRAGDISFVGNIVDAMVKNKNLITAATRIITIGSDKMMAAVAHAKQTVLKSVLAENCLGVASVNSPMQCMMKEICAQCIQEHRDENGKTTYVFSCTNQDQCLEKISFTHLSARLKQNSLQEKISKSFLEKL